MNRDQLLGELGGLARREGEAEKARLDERWDRLAAGTLTPEEDAELKALAESSPEARETYEAFRPLGADFQARMVGAINAERAADAPRPEPQEPRPRVLPFRRAVRRIEVWLGTAAAAAGVFFFLRAPAVLPPLPGYELASLVVPSDYRGSGSHTASPGSPVTLTVRPRTAVTGKVEARGFLSCGGGDLHPWPLKPLNVTEKGIMTLQGRLGKDIQPGSSCDVWIVAARPGKAPDDLQAELRARRTGNADWQAVPTRLDVRLPP
jgi:hypothetical protein